MALSIAMDGPAGAGKSTVALAVVEKLGILHLDTGAMYRALGIGVLRAGVALSDEQAVSALCSKMEVTVSQGEKGQHTYLNGEDVTALLRTPEVDQASSTVSKYADVRRQMVDLQRKLAMQNDMLMDGRDIGTCVLPDATVKFYLTASPEERAKRRLLQKQQKGENDETYEEVLAGIIKRDDQDMNREVNPLRPAEDAIVIDTTEMPMDEVIELVLKIVEEKRA